MDDHLVQLDPETHTVRVGAGVTRTTLRRLYGIAVVDLVEVERRRGVVVARTYTARPGAAASPGARRPGR